LAPLYSEVSQGGKARYKIRSTPEERR
jgi:hypothetical protein